MELKVGAQYVRVNDPDTIWTVRRIVDLPRLPPHAELESGGLHRRRVLVSSLALREGKSYRPASESVERPFQVFLAASSRSRGWRSLLGW